jgi:hypothetical protein
MFVVLQWWDETSPSLLEAIVEITYDGHCYDPYSGHYTDRMICAQSTCEGKGPCWVRCS